MQRLIPIQKTEDIPSQYQNTPIGNLLEYHNLNKPLIAYDTAQILVGMCMDNRKHLNIPDNFAFIMRTGGANLRYSEFKVSYAISVGQVEYIAIIAHDNCGMVNLNNRKQEFISGLVERGGWNIHQAEEHFQKYSHKFEIINEIDFVLSEAVRLRERYPKVTVVPLMYLIKDNKLYMLED